MKRKIEYLLQMGYWSDAMEADRLGPDVFFIAFTVRDPRDAIDLLAEAVELLLEAWIDKYRVDLELQDLFWECSARPA